MKRFNTPTPPPKPAVSFPAGWYRLTPGGVCPACDEGNLPPAQGSRGTCCPGCGAEGRVWCDEFVELP
jgi:hypothetical protein